MLWEFVEPTRDDDVGRRRIGVEVFDQSGAMGKHRALVDRTFVGDLAHVKRRRFGEQDGAVDASRRAAVRIRERFQKVRECVFDPGVLEHHRGGGVRRQIRRQLPASVDVRNDQGGDVVAVGSRQYDVTHQRRAMRDKRHAQRSDADPGAGGELEVLGNAPVEKKAFGRIGGVLEFERVADFIKPFLVEGGRSDGRRAPIAGRNVGALEPGLELALLGNEFDLDTRQRQADIADALAVPATGQCGWTGLR